MNQYVCQEPVINQSGFNENVVAVAQFSSEGHEYLKIWKRKTTRMFPTLPSCVQNYWMRCFIGRHDRRFSVRINRATPQILPLKS